MNQVTMIGNLTRDPELTTTTSGVPVCRFCIAVTRSYTSGNGERQTDFFNIIAWRNQAENCGKFLKKGNKVGISGRLETRSYEDKDGVKRMATEIIANEVEFLTPKTTQETEKKTSWESLPVVDDSDDGLPF